MKCSIIIPTRNRAKVLKDFALKSLNELDFPEEKFEVIVVDNGSSDDTKKVVREFANRYPRFPLKYFNEPEPRK